jgi:hypothetical protein
MIQISEVRRDESTHPTDQSAHRYLPGGDWSSGRLYTSREAWPKADAHRRNRVVAIIRANFCALFDLEIAGSADSSSFDRKIISF